MTFSPRPEILLAGFFYLLLVAGIGVWSYSRTRSARDFWIAGQRLGLWLTALATMSAAFSGFVFVGGPGLTYKIGLSSLFINLSIGFTPFLLAWVLGRRLRLLAEVREVYTIPDALLCRFGSRAASGLAAVAIAVGSVGYLGAQLLACGRVLEAVLGLPARFGEASFLVAVAIGVAVVLFYSVAGGMVAGVYTDIVQGVLMVVAAVAVFGFALHSGGGLSQIVASLSSSETFGRSFVEPFGKVPPLMALSFFFVFGIGILGQPHVLHKFYMLKDPLRLRHLPVVLGAVQILCLLLWFGIGSTVPALVARGEMPPLASPDDAAPAFLLGFTPPWIAGAAFAAVIAAIMSTGDALVSVASAALVRDLPKAFGRRVERELYWGRWATVGVMVGAAVLALVSDDLIALLGTFAFGLFGAALAPALAVGLNWRRVTAAAAVASIATGLVATLAFELLARAQAFPFPPGVLPGAVALAASFTALFAVTAWTKPEPLPADVTAVMEI